MINSKWLLVSAVLALGSMGLAGCGEDDNGEDVECTPETVADDCAETELCVEDALRAGGTGFVCRQDCQGGELCPENFECGEGDVCRFVSPTCDSDDDCGAGQTCDTTTGECFTDVACTSDEDCPGDQTCNTESGFCEIAPTGCEDTSACYDQTAYCAEGTDGNECFSVACPSAGNTCNSCNESSLDPSGPLVFDLRLTGGCERADSGDNRRCLSDAPFACEWSFAVFDPDNNFSADRTNITVYTSRGGSANPFGTNQFEESGIDRISFTTCETNSDDVSGFDGVSYVDDSGASSNVICFQQ